MSAMKAGMSRNTARKYLRQNDPMEQRLVPHTWRTRSDPLAEVWPQAQEMLRQAPELEAKALFEHLSQAHPGKLSAGLLRTFQRRVRSWRLAEGPEDKEVFFSQKHQPGEVLAVDWTEIGSLQVTIEGRALNQKLFHAVLPYSNWEWAVRARSESVLSLRAGLNAALCRLGRAPRQLLIDHSSTATHQLSREGVRRGFNEEFLGVCAHFGIQPRTINVARPQENGDCESSHGHLKRRLRQHLLLRGSRDFASEEEFDRFLIEVLEAANGLRAARVSEELAAMSQALIEAAPDYREVMVTVGNNSTIRVRKLVYSVPSRLIGAKLLARIYENRIVLWAGAQEVAQLPLGRGESGAVIDFRHIIGHLLRKPGAFAGYRWREELFPAPVYRAAHDHFTRACPQSADRRYLEVLQVAAEEGQTAVENALEQLLGAPRPSISASELRAVLESWRDEQRQWRERPPLIPCLTDYDALLDEPAGEEHDELALIGKEVAA